MAFNGSCSGGRRGKAAGRARWDGVRYFRARAALLRFCRPLSGGNGALLAPLEALPEHVADGRAEGGAS